MQNTKGKAIASLVCGIIGIVIAWFGWGSIVSLLLGILSLVFAVQVRKANDENKGMATAGLVLGIITVVLGGICLACWACAFCFYSSSTSALYELANYY